MKLLNQLRSDYGMIVFINNNFRKDLDEYIHLNQLNEDPLKFQRVCKFIRSYLGLSQYEFAKWLNTSQYKISSIERLHPPRHVKLSTIEGLIKSMKSVGLPITLFDFISI